MRKLFIFEVNRFKINISETIERVSVYTEIVPIICYLLFSKKLFSKGLWVIFLLPTISCLHNIYSLYLRDYEHRSNFLFYNIEQLVETMLLYHFFYRIIKNISVKRSIFFLILMYVALWGVSLYKFQDTRYFSSCTNFENLTVLGLIIFYYYEKIIVINSAFIYADPVFWIVTAFFIYIAGTFFLYLFIPSLNLKEQGEYYDVFNFISIIIRTILITIATFIKPIDNNTDNLIKREGVFK